MREIKFRAWDFEGDKMLPQEALQWNGKEFIAGIWNFEETHIESEEYTPLIEQYTGLKDKNGTEIYEGDIVEVEECGVKAKHEVIYGIDFDYPAFELKPGFDGIEWNSIQHLFVSNDIDGFKVIGNIHENKELLD